VEGKQWKYAHHLDDLSVILRGLSRSDLVLVSYRTRAGSRMKGAEAFRGTDFEFANAVRLRKPVFLYVIRGGRWDPDLQAVLALLLDPTVNLQRARVVQSERAALVQIEKDMVSVATGIKIRRMDNGSSGPNGLLLLDSQFLEDTLRRISGTRAESGLDAAADVARTVPILYPSNASDRLRVAYLEVLSLCANLWANHAQYRQAERASGLAARLAMELGDWRRMFSEIQALSGILNMGGCPPQKVYPRGSRDRGGVPVPRKK